MARSDVSGALVILTYLAESKHKVFYAFCEAKYLSVCVCNHAQFYKLNVYFFCRIDADGHQNRWRPSSTPTNTFHEDRTPFPFLSLTALFLFCAPQSCTQIAHASRPRRPSQRSSRRRAPPIMICTTTPHSLTTTSSRKREEGWKKK